MKKWYKSRTLYLNLIGAVAFFAQAQFGFVVPVELQGMLLAALNALLRFDTDEGISL